MNIPVAHSLEPPRISASSFLADARAGLCRAGQKSLPPKYLYDELGSLLFEAITRLHEYGVWRAERRLLEAHAATIAASSSSGLVVELGSGSAQKTRPVLESLLQRGRVTYRPVEISWAALDAATRALADLGRLDIQPVAAEYISGLDEALRNRTRDVPALVLFLGSSLGNFDPLASVRFLHGIRRRLLPGDAFLLGTDLEKPEAQLVAAYDDPLGVTAAFDLNLLVRMNRELGANFRLPQFRHRVRFDAARRNVEMHIESLCEQSVRIGDFGVTFRAGETIHTENSHKFTLGELDGLLRGSGFRRVHQWRDESWRFATTLCTVD
jgi:dimethylhistidine N-methyltransferase